MNGLIRYRYNTMANETPNGELKWRVIFERDGGRFEEVLVKTLYVNVPSFSQEDECRSWDASITWPATGRSR